MTELSQANDDLHNVLAGVDNAVVIVGMSSEETVGSALASLGALHFADPGLRERLEGVFASASLLRGYEMRLRSPDGGEHTARVGASLIPASTEVPLTLLSIEPTGQASSGEAS